jgi:hypothetical protein
MCSMRYQAKKEEAWKWEDTLTPYGIKLRDAAVEDITTDKRKDSNVVCPVSVCKEFLRH